MFVFALFAFLLVFAPVVRAGSGFVTMTAEVSTDSVGCTYYPAPICPRGTNLIDSWTYQTASSLVYICNTNAYCFDPAASVQLSKDNIKELANEMVALNKAQI